MKSLFLAATALGGMVLTGYSAPTVAFERLQLTGEFWAEGAHVGDFNRDKHMDIVCGPFWYEGPSFKARHAIWPAKATFERKKADGTTETLPGFEGGLGSKNAYADVFLTFTHDFNEDGWMDVLTYPIPGAAAAWYENPRNKGASWTRHEIFDVLDNESPGFADITGDGRPEILCCTSNYLGYAEADWKNPAQKWAFHAVSPKGPDYQKFMHGLGSGDVNGDGRIDLVEKDGWWEQPAKRTEPWKKHQVPFAKAAAQLLVYDVNGDKLADVITAVDAHGYGLLWWEQFREGKEIQFKEHVILNSEAKPNAQGVSFSQVHALALADMDRDGLQDIVTGKRFWAHGPSGDPEPNAPAVLYWFKLTRPQKGQAEYTAQLIDDNSGVGTQVTAAFVTNRRYPDVVVGNKKGLFLLKNAGPRP